MLLKDAAGNHGRRILLRESVSLTHGGSQLGLSPCTAPVRESAAKRRRFLEWVNRASQRSISCGGHGVITAAAVPAVGRAPVTNLVPIQ